MNYRALTIAREYGSGGAEIAELAAGRLGWRLVDRALINEISNRAKVPAGQAAALDEQVDPWFHRLTRAAVGGRAAMASRPWRPSISSMPMRRRPCPPRSSRKLTASAVAWIVGRGSQAILHGKPDVFHVLCMLPGAKGCAA